MVGTGTRARTPILVGAAVVVISLLLQAAPARADDPPFVGWTAALPAIDWTYTPGSSDACVAGKVSCVQTTIQRMQKRFDPLAGACTHSAVFALAYLRTTQAYLRTATTAGFYRDPRFVNHEDAAFAAMYFTAYDRWTAGRIAYVPPAWRIALEAGSSRRVSGMGDLLLGMNAHVNRDLPFVLAKIGLVAPDGSSRKPDHDKVNVMLNRVVQPLVAEEAARFDPQMQTAPTPYGIGFTGLMQALLLWRESAWRQAEQLVAAPTPAARAVVAQGIEDNAAANAQTIVAATEYAPPVTTTTSRDRYCASYRPGRSPGLRRTS
jgi:Family of unknown function (DUF5995)